MEGRTRIPAQIYKRLACAGAAKSRTGLYRTGKLQDTSEEGLRPYLDVHGLWLVLGLPARQKLVGLAQSHLPQHREALEVARDDIPAQTINAGTAHRSCCTAGEPARRTNKAAQGLIGAGSPWERWQ